MKKCVICVVWTSWVIGAVDYSQIDFGVHSIMMPGVFHKLQKMNCWPAKKLATAIYLGNKDDLRGLGFSNINVCVKHPAMDEDETEGALRPAYFYSYSWDVLQECLENGADLNSIDTKGNGFFAHKFSLMQISGPQQQMLKKLVEKISERDPYLLITAWRGKANVPLILAFAYELLDFFENKKVFIVERLRSQNFSLLKKMLAATPRDLLRQSDGSGNFLQIIALCKERSVGSDMHLICDRLLGIACSAYAQVGLSCDPNNQETIDISSEPIEMPIIFEQRKQSDCVIS